MCALLLGVLLMLESFYEAGDHHKLHCVYDAEEVAWCMVRPAQYAAPLYSQNEKDPGGKPFTEKVIGCKVETSRGTCNFLNCPSKQNGNRTCRFVPDQNFCRTLVLGSDATLCINWRLIRSVVGAVAIVIFHSFLHL